MVFTRLLIEYIVTLIRHFVFKFIRLHPLTLHRPPSWYVWLTWLVRVNLASAAGTLKDLTLLHLLLDLDLGRNIVQPSASLLVVRKPGGDCCTLSLKTTEEDEEEIKEANASLAAAKLISVDALIVVLSQQGGIFHIKRRKTSFS